MVFATQLKKGKLSTRHINSKEGVIEDLPQSYLNSNDFQGLKASLFQGVQITCTYLFTIANSNKFHEDGKDPIQIFHVHIHFNPTYIIAFTFTPTHFGSVNHSHICLSPFK